MNPIAFALVLMVVVCLALRGAACLSLSRSMGLLNCILAASLFSLLICVRSGSVVIAPEFGQLMAQGAVAVWTLRIALILCGLLPSLGWNCAMEGHGRAATPRRGLAIGFAVGVCAATRVQLINPYDFESLHVVFYDVWWPPLVVWMTIGLAGVLIELAKIKGALKTIAFGAIMLAPMARFALVHQELSDPVSRSWWGLIEPTALLLGLLAFARTRRMTQLKRWLLGIRKGYRYATVLIILAVLGVVAIGLSSVLPDNVKLLLDIFPSFAYLVILGAILRRRRRLADQNGHWRDVIPNSWVIAARLRFVEITIPRIQSPLAVTSLVVLPLLTIDFFSLGILPRGIEFGLLTLTWLILSVRLLPIRSPRESHFVWLNSSMTHSGPFVQTSEKLSTIMRFIGGLRKQLTPLSPADKDGEKQNVKSKEEKAETVGRSGWITAFKGVLLTVGALIVLIAVGEMTNYQKLVVQPFTWSGGSGPEADKSNSRESKESKDEDSKHLSDENSKLASSFSAGVVNALGGMRQELLPILSVSSPSKPGQGPEKVMLAVLDNGATQAAVGKSSDMDIHGVKIPLSLFVEPIQNVVRRLFSIHVVSGSIHKTSDGKEYVVLIDSSGGEGAKFFGKVPILKSMIDDPALDQRFPARTIGTRSKTNLATENKSAGKKIAVIEEKADVSEAEGVRFRENKSTFDNLSDGNLYAVPVCAEGEHDDFEDLIEQTAFRIASTDPSFQNLGLTKNWRAYQFFRSGVRQWDCYQAFGHQSDLDGAADDFRSAVREDGTFAPALYRLGLALQAAGELNRAEKAFEDAASVNPQMQLARIAEAQTLSSSANPFSYRPAISDAIGGFNRSGEARSLWAQIITRASATGEEPDLRVNYGLCTDRWFLDQSPHPRENKFYLTYFFCSKADALYQRLPSSSRDEEQVVGLEAGALFWLGASLHYHDSNVRFLDYRGIKPENRAWLCWNSGLYEETLEQDMQDSKAPAVWTVRGSALTAHALRYFRRSLELNSKDDVVLCETASAAAYLADPGTLPGRAMGELAASTSARLYTANGYALEAVKKAHNQDDDEVVRQAQTRLASLYYQIALSEYRQILAVTPLNADALNGYIETVWQWFQDSINGKITCINQDNPIPCAPTPDDLSAGERIARELVHQAKSDRDPVLGQAAHDSLGEMLITQGRNEEAVIELRAALDPTPDTNLLNERRWDLAQALLCEANFTDDRILDRRSTEEAVNLYAEIVADEQRREIHLFSDTPLSLDPITRRKRCAVPPDRKDASAIDKPILKFQAMHYLPQPGCTKVTSVEAQLNVQGHERVPLELTVIGGEALDSPTNPEGSVQLIVPSNSHRIYFAQAYDPQTKLRSRSVAFDVPNDRKDKNCAHGHVVLEFEVLNPRAQRRHIK